MAGLNKVTLIGNLGQDAQISASNNGMKIAKFSVATSDGKKDSDGNVKTEWHRVVAFGKTAEYIQNYITKGSTVCIEGRIQYGKYDNKDDVTVYTTDIICNNLVNLTKRESTNQSETPHQQSTPQPEQQRAPKQQSFNIGNDITDDDLPF
jgi:single-strand DNA-binding protein